jgi:hypothetical protein
MKSCFFLSPFFVESNVDMLWGTDLLVMLVIEVWLIKLVLVVGVVEEVVIIIMMIIIVW